MKYNIKLKRIGIIAVMSFLLLTVMMIGLKKNGTGKMIVDPGNSVIYFSEEDVLVKGWNTWGVDAEKISCDYYDFLKNAGGTLNTYRGEYMAQYSWAEMTVGRLYNITKAEMAE